MFGHTIHIYLHMKQDKKGNFIVTCRKCHKVNDYKLEATASKRYPICLPCSKGHVVYYEKKTNRYYYFCKSCGEKVYSKTKRDALVRICKSYIKGCSKCFGERISKATTIYTPDVLAGMNIIKNRKNRYEFHCSKGHLTDAKNISYIIELYSGRRTCSICSAIKRLEDGKKSFVNLPNEVWHTILEYPRYSVSSAGRVRNDLKYKLLRPQEVSQKRRYLAVCLWNDIGHAWKQVSRLVAEAFYKNPNDYGEADHFDFNTHNNHSDNISWINHKQNIRHSAAAGRFATPKKKKIKV